MYDNYLFFLAQKGEQTKKTTYNANSTRERKNYCIQMHVSSIQHKSKDPYRFVVIPSQMISSTLIHVLKVNPGVKYPKMTSMLHTISCVFMLDE